MLKILTPVQSGSITIGLEVTCSIKAERRRGLMSNHTATHILNYGLRKAMGEADQKASFCSLR